MSDIKLPRNLEEAERKLLKKGIIIINGEINRRTHDRVAEQLLLLTAAGAPGCTLIITSGGGECDYGFAIYDLLRAYPGDIVGIGQRIVNSMASVILQACKIRCMREHAFMLIHDASTVEQLSEDKLTNHRKMTEIIRRLHEQSERMCSIYLLRAQAPSTRIVAQMKRDTCMTAQEALKLGLIDKIV